VRELHMTVVRPEASLAAHAEWSNVALRSIAMSSPATILAPVPAPDGTFLEKSDQGLRYRTLRLDDPTDLHVALSVEEKARRMASVAVQVARDLRAIERPTGDAAEAHTARRRRLHERAQGIARTGIIGTVPLEARTLDALRGLLRAGHVDERGCDAVAHGDLHPRNVMLAAGDVTVIDLENLMPAPAFTDLLYVARWARRDKSAWLRQVGILSEEVGRRPEQPDLQLCCEVLLVQAEELVRRVTITPLKNLKSIADALEFLLAPEVVR